MAAHSSTLAWKIPWMQEPGGLQSMGSLRVGHDWVTSLSLFTFMHWRRKWQPTPSILAWRIPGTEEPSGLPSMGSHRVGHDWATSLSLSLSCIGEGNGNPLQCSCLENPRDGGAWWAAVSGVAQSRTRLKWLSSSFSSSNIKPWGLPGWHSSQKSACNAGDIGSVPGWEDLLEKAMATHSSIFAWRIS